MAIYVYWFFVALILAGLEMVTGTFYLLVVAIAMVVGGAAALFGFLFVTQFALAALAGLLGLALLQRWKNRQGAPETLNNLDIGQPVKVLTLGDDGSARVFYRGAEWDAELADNASSHEGVFYIKTIRGSVLVLTHRKT